MTVERIESNEGFRPFSIRIDVSDLYDLTSLISIFTSIGYETLVETIPLSERVLRDGNIMHPNYKAGLQFVEEVLTQLGWDCEVDDWKDKKLGEIVKEYIYSKKELERKS